MLHEVGAEPQSTRVAHLVASFMKAIKAQRLRDAEWTAMFERVARSPRIRHAIRQIIQEIEQ